MCCIFLLLTGLLEAPSTVKSYDTTAAGHMPWDGNFTASQSTDRAYCEVCSGGFCG